MVEYGLQLFSIRDMAEKDLKATLKYVAEIGYKYVEFFSFYDHPVEEIKEWLDELGLHCCGLHVSMKQISPEYIEKTVADAKALNCNTIIVPWMKHQNKDVLDLQIARFNFADKFIKANGLQFGYHNHSKEFVPNYDGLVTMEELVNKTDIIFEVDTFWMQNAGVDYMGFLNKNKDRIKFIHLKDGILSDHENVTYDNAMDGAQARAIGEGNSAAVEFRKWAMENDAIMVVESEGLVPTGPEEVARCIKFLRTLD